MVVYDLICCNGHCFEGWFEDAAAFERQLADKLILCPVCNDETIVRKPFVPAVRTHTSSQPDRKRSSTDIQELKQRIAEFVDQHFENVGSRFAAEALKIHYGVAEPRNIRGVSTPQEEKILQDEGVQFFKVDLS
ncbi:MAG: DUF1178 family protein [Thermodesulfobacteriota bacterium]